MRAMIRKEKRGAGRPRAGRGHLLVLLLALAAAPAALAEAPPLEGALADNFILLEEPAPSPDQPFTFVEGETEREIMLQAFAGRVVLLNFWATWCAPCVHEMPALDRLQAKLGESGLAVLAVSNDRGGLRVVAPFFAEHNLAHLDIYLDPRGKLARAFKVRGLPTTVLIDARGHVIGALQGPFEWDGPEAEALIRHYLPATPPEEDLVKTGG